jgi:hypothetical protein
MRRLGIIAFHPKHESQTKAVFTAGGSRMRGVMNACSFKKLVQLLDNQLELDEKLEVLSHLQSCGICHDAVYQISRDRDEKLFVHRPYNVEKHVA